MGGVGGQFPRMVKWSDLHVRARQIIREEFSCRFCQKCIQKQAKNTSEKEAVYRPPPPPPHPTLPSGKISGEGAAAHRLPKSVGINFDLDFCYTHFNWLYKKLGRFPFIRIKMNLKLSTTITNANLQVFVGSVNKKKVHGILFLQS